MSRSPTVSTVRGTKAQLQTRMRALVAQFGEHGVAVGRFDREARGRWVLTFWLTPERESIRQQNLAMKSNGRPVFEPSESQRAILGALLSGSELRITYWGAKPAYKLSSKATREKGEDVALLSLYRLIRKAGEVYRITPEGSRLVLRRLGGNE